MSQLAPIPEVDHRALDDILNGKNPISRLQEVCQQWKFPMPVYRETGGTMTNFGNEVTLTVEGETRSYIELGAKKKLAKTKAAEKALLTIAEKRPHLLEPPPEPVAPDEELVSELRVKAQSNKQRSDALDMRALAKETDELSHKRVTLDLCRIIQQSRTRLGLSQKDFATRINEKPVVVTDYEAGRAIPNDQILAKMERTLGVHLKGERAGLPKVFGRGARRK